MFSLKYGLREEIPFNVLFDILYTSKPMTHIRGLVNHTLNGRMAMCMNGRVSGQKRT